MAVLVNNTIAQVHFAIVDDELEVSAPPELEALRDFFETEIGASDAMLDLIEHHIHHDRIWQFTGDACHLQLDGETTVIENTYTDTRATLTRTELRALLANLRALLTESLPGEEN